MMRFVTAMRGAIAGATVLAGLSLATPVQASPIIDGQVWYFSGNCVDCAEAAGEKGYTVRATLRLTGYVEGTDLQDENFVSFDYEGTNLLFPYLVIKDEVPVRSSSVVHQFNSIAGSLSNAGNQSLQLGFGDGLLFRLDAEGSWFTCGMNDDGYYGVPCGVSRHNDYGDQGTMTNRFGPVPAPPMAPLVGVGLSALGFALRRRTRG